MVSTTATPERLYSRRQNAPITIDWKLPTFLGAWLPAAKTGPGDADAWEWVEWGAQELLFFLYLLQKTYKHDSCWPSTRTISLDLGEKGWSLRTIRRVRAKLERFGILTVEARMEPDTRSGGMRQTSNAYFLEDETRLFELPQVKPGSAPDLAKGGQQRPPVTAPPRPPETAPPRPRVAGERKAPTPQQGKAANSQKERFSDLEVLQKREPAPVVAAEPTPTANRETRKPDPENKPRTNTAAAALPARAHLNTARPDLVNQGSTTNTRPLTVTECVREARELRKDETAIVMAAEVMRKKELKGPVVNMWPQFLRAHDEAVKKLAADRAEHEKEHKARMESSRAVTAAVTAPCEHGNPHAQCEECSANRRAALKQITAALGGHMRVTSSGRVP